MLVLLMPSNRVLVSHGTRLMLMLTGVAGACPPRLNGNMQHGDRNLWCIRGATPIRQARISTATAQSLRIASVTTKAGRALTGWQAMSLSGPLTGTAEITMPVLRRTIRSVLQLELRARRVGPHGAVRHAAHAAL